jgi:ABC-type transport system involved in cytochrome c biogenesis permease subunit
MRSPGPRRRAIIGPVAKDLLLLVCAPYAAAAVGYLEARRRGEPAPRWARILGAATVLLHLAGLLALGAQTHRSPFQTSSQALSFLAFSLGLLYVVLEATSRIATYGGTFLLLTALLAASSVPGLAGAETPAAPRTPDASLAFHMGLALLGTAAILCGGLLSAGYLNAYRRVRTHEIGPESAAAPSLSGLQRLARDASFLGVALLGPALVLGGLVATRGGGPSTAAAVELLVTGVEFALALIAAWLWWRRPLWGAAAAWCNLAATGVAVVAFGVVHPFLARGGA